MEADDPIYCEMGENYASVENEWGDAFDAGEFVPLYICAPGVNDRMSMGFRFHAAFLRGQEKKNRIPQTSAEYRKVRDSTESRPGNLRSND